MFNKKEIITQPKHKKIYYSLFGKKLKWLGTIDKGRGYCDICKRFLMKNEIKTKKTENRISVKAKCKFCGSKFNKYIKINNK